MDTIRDTEGYDSYWAWKAQNDAIMNHKKAKESRRRKREAAAEYTLGIVLTILVLLLSSVNPL